MKKRDIIWSAFLLVMLIIELVLIGIPNIQGINVTSKEMIGSQVTSPTDINGLINPTATKEPEYTYSSGVRALSPVVLLVFFAAIIFVVLAQIGVNKE